MRFAGERLRTLEHLVNQTVIGARRIIHVVLLNSDEISPYLSSSAMTFLSKLARIDVLI